MGLNALEDCLEKCNIIIDEIEMLVVCTDTPEYVSPSNASYRGVC